MKPLVRNILIVTGGVVIVFAAVYFLVIRKELLFTKKTTENTNATEPYFLNLSKDVKYIGDEECYACHSEIYNNFKKTGMGRSFYVPSSQSVIEDYERNNIVYDSKSDFYYKMYREDDKFYQEEYRLDEKGKRIHEFVRRIDYVIGSGIHTRSYISSENGFLYELPVTWYIEKKKWDLSPGYQKKNMRFSRAINQECLNCHNSYAEYIDYTENRFKENIPVGIGCERCHGPGETHVKFQNENMRRTGKIDRTIVNPNRLDAKLQLDVCFQCHLEGDIHVFKEGIKQTDFRPGMKLSDIKAVYFHEDINPGDFKIASHGARMSMSECFKKSGKMLCTTCHDPHIPVESVPRNEFNDKCKTCHDVSSLSPSSKKADHREMSDCISCHMRQGGTSDIPHVNFTDHWIRREIRILSKKEIDSVVSVNKSVTFKEFFKDLEITSSQINEIPDSLAEIELGIAYVKYYDEKQNLPDYLNRAIPMLERGLHYFPDNEGGLYYLGMAYMHLRKFSDAEKNFKRLVSIDPHHGLAYYQLGTVLEKMNRLNEAIVAYQNTVNLIPEYYKAYNSLGNIYSQLGNIQKAIEYYQQGIKVMPVYAIIQNNLGDVYFHQLNDTSNARKYIEAAVKLDPDFTMALLNLGNLELAEGHEAEAERLFKTIIRIDDRFAPAYGNLAVIYSRRGKKEEAIKYLNKLIEIDPKDMQAQKMLNELKK